MQVDPGFFHSRGRLAALTLAVSLSLGLSAATVVAADAPAMGHDMSGDAGMAMPPAGKGPVMERTVTLNVPGVKLVREDGKSVLLPQELDDGRPVLVNFIYTTCFGICPISSQTFAQFQKGLGSEAAKVHLVSVSIDPEEDTPPVLRQYARKYHAGPGWNHYTGTIEASIATQKAFGVYKGDKMNHDPVTLMRVAANQPWLRIDGFATAEDLLRIYRRLRAAS